MTDTIAAIATPPAPGGIGILRISGSGARKVADRIFRAKSGKNLTDAKGYTACYGAVYDKASEIGEAVALVFSSPKSYTGENVVELSCHGGLFVMQKVLRAALEAGARLAEAGEFTKRAFLNGKIRLDEAEAVMNIIAAGSEKALRSAISLKDGAITRRIEPIKNTLIAAAAHMSAWVDYPDEEIEDLDFGRLRTDFSEAAAALTEMIARYDAGRAIREGVDAVIVGRPNVGKSTLMNLLAGCERSIVTSIPGTTRDVVEDTVRLGDVILRLSDTAGIRSTSEPVEKIGVERARRRLSEADLVLAVFDSSEPLDEADRALIREVRKKRAIIIINKNDLEKRLETGLLEREFENIVYLSAGAGTGLDALAAAVNQILSVCDPDLLLGIPATERQRNCCIRAREGILAAIDAIDQGLTMDAVNVCVDEAIGALLELTGESVSEAVVADVFKNFCVGK